MSYLVAVLVPALDAILPVLPGETAVIALGVATAGHTDPKIAMLVTLAAFGALLGDNLAYQIGRRFGQPPSGDSSPASAGRAGVPGPSMPSAASAPASSSSAGFFPAGALQ